MAMASAMCIPHKAPATLRYKLIVGETIQLRGGSKIYATQNLTGLRSTMSSYSNDMLEGWLIKKVPSNVLPQTNSSTIQPWILLNYLRSQHDPQRWWRTSPPELWILWRPSLPMFTAVMNYFDRTSGAYIYIWTYIYIYE